MPIPVVCSNCQTRLNAPDAAAGRKVKCPKCQAVLPVPAAGAPPAPPPPPPAADAGSPFDFGGGSPPPPAPRPSRAEGRSAPRPPESEPEPASPPPPAGGGGGAFDFGSAVASAEPPAGRDRGRRRRDDDDAPPPARGDRPRRPRPRDDDDAPEGDDDRPRGRGGKPGGKKGKFPVALVIGIAAAVLLMCCGGPLGAYFVFIQPKLKEWGDQAKALNDAKQKQIDDENKRRAGGGEGGGDASGGKAGPPTGWKEFTAKDKSFKAYFPNEPKEESGPPIPPVKKGAPPPSIKMYSSDTEKDDVLAMVVVLKFTAGFPAGDRDKIMDQMARDFTKNVPGKAENRTTSWLGQANAKESVVREPGGPGAMVVRSATIGTTGYVGIVGFKEGRKEELEKGFFDTFEALAK